jgi:AcrR family transcriptional regulator
MSGDRRSLRREATRDEIVRAAWTLAREQGLAGISMRDLGARVGMRAQSVYTYFASKDAIYDAMFQQGYRDFLTWMTADESERVDDALGEMRRVAHRFFTFCVSDPERYQLLFLRTIPGFVPSAESYAVAVAALDHQRSRLAAVGVTDPHAADLATAVFTGLTSQQIANDPGGNRWELLVDRAARMLLAEVAPQLLSPSSLAPAQTAPPRPHPRKKVPR